MPKPNKKDKPLGKLDALEKRLYVREEEVKAPPKESPVEPSFKSSVPVSDVPSEWEDDTAAHIKQARSRFFHMDTSLITRVLLVATIFLIASAGVAAYIFFGGSNRVSTENIDINVVGPASVGAGETLSFELAIQNQNNVELEGVNLLVEYPPGTRTASDQSKELLRESEPLGNIPVGGIIKRSKQAVLFGEADNIKSIIVSVEYRVKDSSATYFKEKHYDLVISTAPISLKIDSLKEVVSGKEVELSAEIISNSSSLISGLLLRVDYPFGFAYLGSVPASTYGNNVFALGDLKPTGRRVIRIRGTVEGQENEERSFRFSLGLRDKRDDKLIGTVFLTSNQSVTIKKPFIGIALSLDGSNDEIYATGAGQLVRGELSWSNNLPGRITDVEIQAKLSGESLNRLAITANRGFYRSLDNIILWNKTTDNNFAVLEPSESGSASFSFASLPASALIYSSVKGNEISIDISVRARRLSDTDVPEEIISTVSKKVRIFSDIGIVGHSFYFTGPFSNQGPIPPKADQHTTYTIVWTITNTLNTVSDTEVKATLPGYMQWLGRVSPADESVTFDPESHQIVWSAGSIPSGTGFVNPVRQVAFQVALVPSLSQRDTEPILVGPTSITGVDRFTGTTLKDNAREITTLIEDGFSHPGNTSRVEP